MVEIRWQTKELKFYDSLAACGHYDLRVKERIMTLLAICEELYSCDLEIVQWQWIGEQVCLVYVTKWTLC